MWVTWRVKKRREYGGGCRGWQREANMEIMWKVKKRREPGGDAEGGKEKGIWRVEVTRRVKM